MFSSLANESNSSRSYGNSVHNMQYNIIPILQQSALNPLYGLPPITSGAVYENEPHNVSSNCCLLLSRANPKSIQKEWYITNALFIRPSTKLYF